MILFKLLLWLIPISANVYADYAGRKPFYLLMFILRGGVAIIHSTIILWNVPTSEFYTATQLFIVWSPVLIFEITSYWLLFEIALNVLRKKPLLYYDHKEKDSGWIDRFFMWAGPTWHTAAKLAALVLFILSTVTLIHIYG